MIKLKEIQTDRAVTLDGETYFRLDRIKLSGLQLVLMDRYVQASLRDKVILIPLTNINHMVPMVEAETPEIAPSNLAQQSLAQQQIDHIIKTAESQVKKKPTRK